MASSPCFLLLIAILVNCSAHAVKRMLVSPKNSYVEILTSDIGDRLSGRILDCEGGALLNGINALMKETLELSHPFHHLKKWLAPDTESPDTEFASTLILDFPASRTLRNKCLLCKSSRLWYFVMAFELPKTG